SGRRPPASTPTPTGCSTGSATTPTTRRAAGPPPGCSSWRGGPSPANIAAAWSWGAFTAVSFKGVRCAATARPFRAGHAHDFLVSGDKNFRPINMRWGPDGSIYVIDWHDQNPCHQAAPDSWDMTHGRIYKIQRKGARNTPPPDLARKSSKELVSL